MVVRIDQWPAAEFTGTTTRIAGRVTPTDNGRANGTTVVFKETGYEVPGQKEIDFAGEYRAVIGEELTGAWFKGNRRVAEFRFE
jgi:hypothetical protein